MGDDRQALDGSASQAITRRDRDGVFILARVTKETSVASAAAWILGHALAGASGLFYCMYVSRDLRGTQDVDENLPQSFFYLFQILLKSRNMGIEICGYTHAYELEQTQPEPETLNSAEIMPRRSRP